MTDTSNANHAHGVAPGANSAARVLTRPQLDDLFSAIQRRDYNVVGATVRDGAIVIDDLGSPADLPAGWRDRQAPGSYRLEQRQDGALFGHVVGPHSFKQLFHVPEERLFQLRRHKNSFQTVFPTSETRPKLALVGARACEIAAIAVQDEVLMNGATPDPRYVSRREGVLVIAASCNEPGGNCFCVSMGGGPRPTHGFDLSLTELLPNDGGPHRFVVDVGSEAGAELMAELDCAAAVDADVEAAEVLATTAAANMGRTLDTDGIKQMLYAAAEHPRWEHVAERCLACTSCTMVCPTCFCSRVDDVTSLDGEMAERVRSWDSCFSLEYSHMHGGPVRSSVSARYRQWLTHKFASWIDQFGSSGCVGCGRCISWCPAAIDVTEEIAAIREQPTTSPERGT